MSEEKKIAKEKKIIEDFYTRRRLLAKNGTITTSVVMNLLPQCKPPSANNPEKMARGLDGGVVLC
jgi:hypothetical protein